MSARLMAFGLNLGAAALLAACHAEPTVAPSDPPLSDRMAQAPKANPQPPTDDTPNVNASEPNATECGADELGRYLNLLPTQTARDEIAKAVGDRPIRYIAPDDVVTMDFRPERLNVETGPDGRIKLFRCG